MNKALIIICILSLGVYTYLCIKGMATEAILLILPLILVVMLFRLAEKENTNG